MGQDRNCRTWVALIMIFFFFFHVVNRGLVYALPPGSPHQLGIEDGLGCHGWEASQSKTASSALRSSQMLTLFFNSVAFYYFLQIPVIISLFSAFFPLCLPGKDEEESSIAFGI